MEIKENDCYENIYVTSKISNNNTLICFYNCTFASFDSTTSNYSTTNGIIIYLSNSKSSFDCCTFSNNSIFSNSNLMYLSSTNITFSDNFFIDNYIIYNQLAEGCFIYLTASNSSFFNNSFSNNYFYGDNNSAPYDRINGSMIYLSESNGYFNICLFLNNIIYSNSLYHIQKIFGGFLYLTSSNGTIDNCTFISNFLYQISENYLYLQGGFICLLLSIFDFYKCSFADNSIHSINNGNKNNYINGISIHLVKCYCDYIECNFQNNTIYVKAVHECEICGYINLELSNCHFYECNFFKISLNLNNSNIIIIDGELIFLRSSNCTIDKCYFVNNQNDFANQNSCDYNGMLNIFYSNLKLNVCKLINNMPFLNLMGNFYFNGNILRIYDSNSEINKCIFESNFIENYNYLCNGALCIIKSNCSFFENKFHHNYLQNTNYINDYPIYGGPLYLRNSDCTFMLCKFNIYNSLYTTDMINGLIIYMSASKSFFDNCRFNTENSIASKINGIIFFTDINDSYIPALEICNCVFNIRFDSSIEGNSILYFDEIRNLDKPKYLTNNCFIINGSCDIVVFNGILKNCKLKFYFENNCLYPHENQYFVKDDIQIYDQNGIDTFSFNDAFNQQCRIPTPVFTSSNMFTDSDQFTKSNLFVQTDVFTYSYYFSFSNYFAKSNQFSPSEQFTKSNQFSESNQFSNSRFFSNSHEFTKSCYSTQTVQYSDSDVLVSKSSEKYKKLLSYSITYYIMKSVSFSYSIHISLILFNIYHHHISKHIISL